MKRGHAAHRWLGQGGQAPSQPSLFDPARGDCPSCQGTGGETRPPNIPDYAQPYVGNMISCPQCRYERFDYMSADYGACERPACGYEWHAKPCVNCNGTGSPRIPYS